MKNIFFSMFFALLCTPSASIFAKVNNNNSTLPMKYSVGEVDYLSPDLIETGRLSVRPMMIEGFSASGLEKLKQAFKLLEEVLNSSEFKDRVINFKNGQGERRYASNNGFTNEQIYQIFMEGREILLNNTPGEMNLFLKLYNNPLSNVIGYTTPTSNVININNKFFRNYRVQDVAANLTHEWLHKLGFDHQSAREHDSVPYAIGYMIRDMVKKLSRR